VNTSQIVRKAQAILENLAAYRKGEYNGQTMRILGIDPGIGRMGWGIIHVQNAQCTVLNHGCIETAAGMPVEKRLKEIYNELMEIITIDKPEEIAVEELFFNTNVTTAFTVGQARGVALLAGAMCNVSVATYTPLQVKLAIAGYGRAEKKQVEKMVGVLLKMEKLPKRDDTVDALAIALTHAFSRKLSLKKR